MFRALAGQLVLPSMTALGATCDDIIARCGRAPEAVAVCTVDGQFWTRGDVDAPVCLQELSHCIAYLVARDELGRDAVHKHIGLLHGVMYQCGQSAQVGSPAECRARSLCSTTPASRTTH